MPPFRARKPIVTALAVLSMLLATACTPPPPGFKAKYTLPGLPVSFSIDNNGEISINGEAKLVTFLGTFAIEASDALVTDVTADQTLVRIRAREGGQPLDSDYLIDARSRLSADVDRTHIEVTQNYVFLDASDGEVKNLQFVTVQNPEVEASRTEPLDLGVHLIGYTTRGVGSDYSVFIEYLEIFDDRVELTVAIDNEQPGDILYDCSKGKRGPVLTLNSVDPPQDLPLLSVECLDEDPKVVHIPQYRQIGERATFSHPSEIREYEELLIQWSNGASRQIAHLSREADLSSGAGNSFEGTG